MKELIATNKDGMRIRTVIESSTIVETITALRNKGFTQFIIKTIAGVKQNFDWKENFQWLSAN